ncbi:MULTISPECIES: response regulator transcription factor [Streptomycetaceae]|uniref:Two-component system response regulator n=1 Tax=Streptantibioticus cattleyicolor (strain ATCC 35852 / DSM 46488 / JCM 4925 / NBRC 14057 / NRRL 8057) TaxID=1003195 RepID=F8K372_STREN|nr:DNA-binding response regulator [Streptantibioticus cattleyicolor]AEW93785.1 two-component system response regulator [Streptantibioticus cattleyicolor NRRL 8057 = DSM 46488]MYS58471.1 DNA-binding response regulator [Streptomyces sp. SID5468]CCB74131.1 putative two-component system response regulator [Streptantibioticus cattleyicolor NRRL 8057 = DSM 46488]
MIRVLVVHDTRLLGSALAALLGREDDLDVTATSWGELKSAVRTVRPDVCVVDVECPGSAGLGTEEGPAGLNNVLAPHSGPAAAGDPAAGPSARPRTAAPAPAPGSRTPGAGDPGRPSRPALLVLAAPSKPGLLRRASRAQALGYVNKDAPPDALATAIRRVAEGKRFVDTSLGFDFLRASEIPLTNRELSVLTLAAEGASVAEIARSLHLSNGTVRNYMAAINRKTGARNRVDAIRISQGAGWV